MYKDVLSNPENSEKATTLAVPVPHRRNKFDKWSWRQNGSTTGGFHQPSRAHSRIEVCSIHAYVLFWLRTRYRAELSGRMCRVAPEAWPTEAAPPTVSAQRASTPEPVSGRRGSVSRSRRNSSALLGLEQAAARLAGGESDGPRELAESISTLLADAAEQGPVLAVWLLDRSASARGHLAMWRVNSAGRWSPGRGVCQNVAQAKHFRGCCMPQRRLVSARRSSSILPRPTCRLSPRLCMPHLRTIVHRKRRSPRSRRRLNAIFRGEPWNIERCC